MTSDARPAPAETESHDAQPDQGSTSADRLIPKYGEPGPPLNPRNPFRVGFLAGLGLLLAYATKVALVQLSSVLTLIGVSVFLAFGVDPVLRWLMRRGVKRGLAILLVFVGLTAVFAGFAAMVVPVLTDQGTQLAQQAPSFLTSIQKQDWFIRLDQKFSIVSKVTTQAQQWASGGGVQNVLGGALGVGTAVVTGLFNIFTVLILTLFFTAGMDGFKEAAYRLAPASRRDRVRRLGDAMVSRIGGYVLGQICVATLNGVCSYVMMLILGIPFPLILAVTVGLLGLIPMVGATLGAIVVAVVAAFHSVQSAIIVIAYYVIYQQVENYVIAPRVMERTVAVPAVVTAVAALVGGSLMGVVGALIAVPLAAAVMLIVQEVVYPAQDRL